MRRNLILSENALPWLTGTLGPPERRALREIAEHGDLTVIEGRSYLVAPVSVSTIDALAAFEAEGEDREDDLCDEPDHDDEFDYRGRRFDPGMAGTWRPPLG